MKSKIKWCLKQKNGIILTNPNTNLSNIYFEKSNSALRMLNAAKNLNETEWIAITSYYAKYMVFYALLQKIGIKLEIHECTIELMKLLEKNKIIEKNI